MTRIAIIGAGLSGLITAKMLADHASVTVFEKARGVGGRMSTRYTDNHIFDHGAQYFTLKQAASKTLLYRELQEGTVDRWNAAQAVLKGAEEQSLSLWQDGSPRYVAAPNMNSLAKSLARGADVRLSTKITRIEGEPGKWRLLGEDKADLGTYSWVIVSAPAPQTAELMPACFAKRDAVASAEMKGCYTLMVGLVENPDISWQAARISESPLAWIAINNSKPGRMDLGSVVLQASNDWSQALLEADQNWVREELLREGSQIIGTDLTAAPLIQMHRWRYANVVKPASRSLLLDPDNQLAACGDWCIEGRVEGAIESAIMLAENMRAHL